ncbi:hypothetical protein PviCFBP13515_04915 [Pseudomonas viridiflava]|nr:hypothetical protein PviCFBP13507_14575 [Pseudomonas viridiflava]TKK31531.1 hypothetical protein PviCFBP13515_04915 [Pseudomonas viridiflava]
MGRISVRVMIVPTLRVGMPLKTLRVRFGCDAQRWVRSQRANSLHKQKRPERVGAFCLVLGYQLSRLRVSRAGFSPRGRAGN